MNIGQQKDITEILINHLNKEPDYDAKVYKQYRFEKSNNITHKCSIVYAGSFNRKMLSISYCQYTFYFEMSLGSGNNSTSIELTYIYLHIIAPH